MLVVLNIKFIFKEQKYIFNKYKGEKMKGAILLILLFNIFPYQVNSETTILKHVCERPDLYYPELKAEANKVDKRVKKMLEGLDKRNIKKLEQGYAEIQWFSILKNNQMPIGKLIKAGKGSNAIEECKKY